MNTAEDERVIEMVRYFLVQIGGWKSVSDAQQLVIKKKAGGLIKTVEIVNVEQSGWRAASQQPYQCRNMMLGSTVDITPFYEQAALSRSDFVHVVPPEAVLRRPSW